MMERSPEKVKFYREAIKYAREAAKSVLSEEIKAPEELNRVITNLESETKNPEFREKFLNKWKRFAVAGILQYDEERGERVLKQFTDLDGRCALGFFKKAGFDISELTYVKPGDFLSGAVNLDTGNKFGVVYDESTDTLYFDHHQPGVKEVTSTTEIVYKTLVGLRLLERNEVYDRLVNFVTEVDNRSRPPEEFLRSARTILGLQRFLDFENLLAFFREHENPTDELTPEELEKYGLKEASEIQQKIVDEAMKTLEQMEKEGKVIDTNYGKVVINVNNQLKVGASAAYVKYDGIINFTPGKSFAVTFKNRDIDEKELREKLGERFQGKIIRGKMWIYNENEPLKLDLKDIVEALGGKFG